MSHLCEMGSPITDAHAKSWTAYITPQITCPCPVHLWLTSRKKARIKPSAGSRTISTVSPLTYLQVCSRTRRLLLESQQQREKSTGLLKIASCSVRQLCHSANSSSTPDMEPLYRSTGGGRGSFTLILLTHPITATGLLLAAVTHTTNTTGTRWNIQTYSM